MMSASTENIGDCRPSLGPERWTMADQVQFVGERELQEVGQAKRVGDNYLAGESITKRHRTFATQAGESEPTVAAGVAIHNGLRLDTDETGDLGPLL
jgi:hypothetical protein